MPTKCKGLTWEDQTPFQEADQNVMDLFLCWWNFFHGKCMISIKISISLMENVMKLSLIFFPCKLNGRKDHFPSKWKFPWKKFHQHGKNSINIFHQGFSIHDGNWWKVLPILHGNWWKLMEYFPSHFPSVSMENLGKGSKFKKYATCCHYMKLSE